MESGTHRGKYWIQVLEPDQMGGTRGNIYFEEGGKTSCSTVEEVFHNNVKSFLLGGYHIQQESWREYEEGEDLSEEEDES